MGIGPKVRQALGRWEVPAAEAYRAAFINLDDLAATLASLGEPKRICEIGCGEGAMADRLLRVFPSAEYTGIDVAANPGRLFRGDRGRAEFRSIASGDFLAEGPEPFDLVIFVDVVHHIPPALRASVLRDAAALTAPGGMIAVKEWERARGPAHLGVYLADRYICGDKGVRFYDRAELRTLFAGALPEFEVVCETRIPPRRNNLFHALRRPLR